MIAHSCTLHGLSSTLARPPLKHSLPKKLCIFPLLSPPQVSHSSPPYPQIVFSKPNKRISCSHSASARKPVKTIDSIRHEFDPLFLRFLKQDMHDLGAQNEAEITPAHVSETQLSQTSTHVEDTYYIKAHAHVADTHYAELDAHVADTHCSEQNAHVADTHCGQTTDHRTDTLERGVGPANASPNDEQQELLRSITNVAKGLPANLMLTELLDPYIGRINNRRCNILLQLILEEGLISQGLSFLEWMGFQKPSLVSPRTYSVVFRLLGRAGMTEELWALFRDMPDGREFHCVSVYNLLISGFSCCSRYDDAWKVFEEMEKRNIIPDSVTCSSLVTIMRMSGQNAKETWQFFERMSRKGVKLSFEIFDSLIKSFCDEGLMKEALIILSEMEKRGFEPNVIIYNMLIDAYSKLNQLEEAEGLFLEMKERQLQPTVSTYNSLIDAYSKKGRHGVVEELIQEMEYISLKPDVWTFTLLISAYGRQKKMSDQAENAFLRMKKQGIFPTSHSYTALIHAYSVSGLNEKAYSTFDDMVREGIKPSLETYTMLLDACRRAGNTEKLTEIWQIMTKDGIEWTRVIFNILVDGFAKRGHCREARNVICEFGKKGLKPNVMTYNMLINAYARAGWHTKCPQVLNEMVAAGLKPDAYTYSTLIYAFFRVHDFKKAFYYHKEMVKSNQISDSVSYKKMKALLDLQRMTKSERERKAALAQIRKQMGLPSRNKHTKEFWKNKKPTNRVQTEL